MTQASVGGSVKHGAGPLRRDTGPNGHFMRLICNHALASPQTLIARAGQWHVHAFDEAAAQS